MASPKNCASVGAWRDRWISNHLPGIDCTPAMSTSNSKVPTRLVKSKVPRGRIMTAASPSPLISSVWKWCSDTNTRARSSTPSGVVAPSRRRTSK